MILASHFESEGNFDYDDISQNINENGLLDQTAIGSFEVSITIDNYRIEGSINYKEIIEKAEQYQITEDSEGQKDMERMAQMLNNNVKLDVLSIKENEYVAVSEFFAYRNDRYLKMSRYNEDEWSISMRMKFEDGTSLDDSFFDEGFEPFVDEATGLMDDMDDGHSEAYPSNKSSAVGRHLPSISRIFHLI